VYNNYRSDIANKFPGYANTDGAVGYYYLDTTAYANGVHTIAWSVVDNGGNATGIGSRFFTIFNSGTGAANMQANAGGTFINLGAPLSWAHVISLPVSFEPVAVRKGYAAEAVPEVIHPDPYGVVTIEIPEVERVEIDLSGKLGEKEPASGYNSPLYPFTKAGYKGDSSSAVSSQPVSADHQPGGANSLLKSPGYELMADRFPRYSGYLLVNNELHSLPIGSTLDSERDVFYWQPGPGFLGAYDFVFIKEESALISKKIPIRIKVVPKFSSSYQHKSEKKIK
jgi:hypothetical protein